MTEQKYAYNIKEIQFFSDIARYDDTQSTIAEPWSGTNSLRGRQTASSPYLEDNMAVTAAIELLIIILMRGGQIGPVETTRSLDRNGF